jgi:ribonuclease J
MNNWTAIKGAIKGDLSNYLYKKTKRNPMILPVVTEV